MISSLFIGPIAVGTVGPKWGLVLGMSSYVIYVMCFAASLFFDAGSTGMNICAIIGSAIGGLGAGALWTCQGAFFANTCQHLADAKGSDVSEVTSALASNFAVWYVGMECVFKATFTALQQFADMSSSVGFVIYAVIAFGSTVAIALCPDAPAKSPSTRPGLCDKASAAIALWKDPNIWLLGGSNVAFGFSAAYVVGYINSNWLKVAITDATGDPQLAKNLIGFLGALICFVAAISSKMFQVINSYFGSKVPVITFGAVCFVAIGILSFISAPNGRGPGGWGWGICIFYVLQGVGRGVYESTNKAVFADFYTGAKAPAAFANCMMQNTAAGTIGFLMGWGNLPKQECWPLLIFAVLSVPGLLLAQRIQAAKLPNAKD